MKKIGRWDKEIEKLLRGGGNRHRNTILIRALMFLSGFGPMSYLFVYLAIQGAIQDKLTIIIGMIFPALSMISALIIVYVIIEHSKYRKASRKKYLELTREEFGEIAKVVAMIVVDPNQEHIMLIDESKVYGEIAILGKLFTRTFTWIKLEDIVWVYEKRETYLLECFRKSQYVSNSIIIRDRFGKAYEMGVVVKDNYGCGYYDMVIEEIKQKNRRCSIGYSKEKYRDYKAEPSSFYYRFN